MPSRQSWVEIDLHGLEKLLQRRGKEFAIFELVQNCFDEPGVTRVDVELKKAGAGLYWLRVEDNAPGGWADLRDAYTMFRKSKKKPDPTKRGIFNAGEKLVLALCQKALITTTTGTVLFGAKGRAVTQGRRPAGSLFQGLVKLTNREAREIVQAVHRLIPPVPTFFNGEEIPRRTPLHAFQATLPTTVSDESGAVRRVSRKTEVRLYEALPGGEATLYEMGIPVVGTGDKWDVDVCVAPDVRVLTADLRYVPAGKVEVGDRLLAFDERPQGRHRYFRLSEVKRVRRLVRPCYRLVFDDGSAVVASEDHQWLSARSRSRKWIRTAQMCPQRGRKAGSRVVRVLEAWDTDESFKGGYLAAAFDGEGCVYQGVSHVPAGRRNRLSFVQTTNAMLEQVVNYLTEDGFKPVVKSRASKNVRWSDTTEVTLPSRQEMLRFLGTYRPRRLLARLDVDLLGKLPTGRTVRLVRKELIGDREVVAIETTTRTYIAEGLASHNCQRVPLNPDRDNVPPGFLKQVRVLVLNEMADRLERPDATAPWVREASGDERATDAAVSKVVELAFGPKRVAFDLSDPEANALAFSEGYTVVSGGSLSGKQWANVKRAGAILPAGRVTPSPKPDSPEGDPQQTVPERNWSDGMRWFAGFAQKAGNRLIGVTPAVRIVRDPGWPFQATYGAGRLTVNLSRVGKAFFEHGASRQVIGLLIHEFAHHIEGNHLDARYHDALQELGAKFTCLALEEPALFQQ